MTERYSLVRRAAYAHNSDRPIYWYDYYTGDVILAGGKAGNLSPYIALAELFDKIATHARANDKSTAAVFIRAGSLIKNRPNRKYFSDSIYDWTEVNFKW